jgi:hypothetical protein
MQLGMGPETCNEVMVAAPDYDVFRQHSVDFQKGPLLGPSLDELNVPHIALLWFALVHKPFNRAEGAQQTCNTKGKARQPCLLPLEHVTPLPSNHNLPTAAATESLPQLLSGKPATIALVRRQPCSPQLQAEDRWQLRASGRADRQALTTHRHSTPNSRHSSMIRRALL